MPLFWGFLGYISGLCALLIAGFVGVQTLLAVPAASHPETTVEKPHRAAGLPPMIQPIIKPTATAAAKPAVPHYAKLAKQKALDEISSQRRRHAAREARPPMREDASNAYASGAQPSQFWTRQSWSQSSDAHRPY